MPRAANLLFGYVAGRGKAGGTMRTATLAAALGLAVLGPSAAGATGWTPERPLRTLRFGEREAEATCTVYRDVAVRVSGTGTPSPGDATLLRQSRASCAAAGGRGRVRLDTAGFDLVGRSGSFLFFEQSDPLGATAFRVIDSRNGRTIVDDATFGGITGANALRVVATPSSLVLRYRRGLNAYCSVLERPMACWRKITRDPASRVPVAIARLAPPVAACRLSYGAAAVPADNPVIIAYDVELRWSRGASQTRATGPVGCAPLP